MGIDPNCLLRRVTNQSNTPSLHAAGPSDATEDVVRNAASIDEHSLIVWLDKVRRIANDPVESNLTESGRKRRNCNLQTNRFHWTRKTWRSFCEAVN